MSPTNDNPAPALGVDVPSVTARDAAFLVAHHLSLAASYFEAANVDNDTLVAEIERVMGAIKPPIESTAARAAVIWLAAITESYDGLDDENGESP